MSVLSVCQDASIELSQVMPTAVCAGTSQFSRELKLQANRAALGIAKAYDWQTLTTLGTLTGDGTDTAFDLPADFDRMPKKARVHSETFAGRSFRPAKDLDEWRFLNDVSASGAPGTWILLGGQMQIFPAMAAAATARFYYISSYIVQPVSGANKAAFTADTDTFLLSEKLLALGIVWRWRAMKRVDYSVELESYKLALAEEIGKDRGPKVLTVGRQRIPVGPAFEGVLGGPGGRTFDSTDEPTFDEE